MNAVSFGGLFQGADESTLSDKIRCPAFLYSFDCDNLCTWVMESRILNLVFCLQIMYVVSGCK